MLEVGVIDCCFNYFKDGYKCIGNINFKWFFFDFVFVLKLSGVLMYCFKECFNCMNGEMKICFEFYIF